MKLGNEELSCECAHAVAMFYSEEPDQAHLEGLSTLIKCMHLYMHTLHAYMSTCVHVYMRTYMHNYVHMCRTADDKAVIQCYLGGEKRCS